jgi:hypothetical protein
MQRSTMRSESTQAGRAAPLPREPDPERMEAVRRRIREGVYDRPEVVREVARRMLACGAL